MVSERDEASFLGSVLSFGLNGLIASRSYWSCSVVDLSIILSYVFQSTKAAQ